MPHVNCADSERRDEGSVCRTYENVAGRERLVSAILGGV
jgi:hypothetical protein